MQKYAFSILFLKEKYAKEFYSSFHSIEKKQKTASFSMLFLKEKYAKEFYSSFSL